jgi:predicted GIY-YIG superfamily endonuclease
MARDYDFWIYIVTNARESQLEKWSRAKKVALINRMNPNWDDLGVDVLQDL